MGGCVPDMPRRAPRARRLHRRAAHQRQPDPDHLQPRAVGRPPRHSHPTTPHHHPQQGRRHPAHLARPQPRSPRPAHHLRRRRLHRRRPPRTGPPRSIARLIHSAFNEATLASSPSPKKAERLRPSLLPVVSLPSGGDGSTRRAGKERVRLSGTSPTAPSSGPVQSLKLLPPAPDKATADSLDAGHGHVTSHNGRTGNGSYTERPGCR